MKHFIYRKKVKYMIRLRKLYDPETLKYCLELWIGWRSWKLTGFWFGQSYDQMVKEDKT